MNVATPMDPGREQFLRDRVQFATPVQRVVLLYDRLALDLTRARMETDRGEIIRHVEHAGQVVQELLASLDAGRGAPADDLALIYAFLVEALHEARDGDVDGLLCVAEIVGTLRFAWSMLASGTMACARPAAQRRSA